MSERRSCKGYAFGGQECYPLQTRRDLFARDEPKVLLNPNLQTSRPSIWSMVSTCPPAFLMRSRSSFRKGVWSTDNGRTALSPPSARVHNIARESPTLATNNVSPFVQTPTT